MTKAMTRASRIPNMIHIRTAPLVVQEDGGDDVAFPGVGVASGDPSGAAGVERGE
jgi:hypothetical protein